MEVGPEGKGTMVPNFKITSQSIVFLSFRRNLIFSLLGTTKFHFLLRRKLQCDEIKFGPTKALSSFFKMRQKLRKNSKKAQKIQKFSTPRYRSANNSSKIIRLETPNLNIMYISGSSHPKYSIFKHFLGSTYVFVVSTKFNFSVVKNDEIFYSVATKKLQKRSDKKKLCN